VRGTSFKQAHQTGTHAALFTAQVCLSRGALIKLLISSNIGRYLEFKAVNDTSVHLGHAVREVPCSKKTLLLNKHVQPREKRQLMKLLLSSAPKPGGTADSGAGDAGGTSVTFGDSLRDEWKFSAEVCTYIVHAIAGVSPTVSVSSAPGSTSVPQPH